MKNDNLYINIGRHNKRIARITKLRHVESLFKNSENCLIKPSEWEDKFENQLLKSKFVRSRWINSTPTIETITFADIQKHWYGQCWSYTDESDGLWQIYSPAHKCKKPAKDLDDCGIQLISTPKLLIKNLSQAAKKKSPSIAYIGKVLYGEQTQIVEGLMKLGPDLMDLSSALDSQLAMTLLIKRNAFKHENELRLLWHVPNFNKTKIFYEVDPQTMITEIIMDPRITDREESHIRKKIGHLVGSIPITKSQMHSPFNGSELKLPDV